MMTTEMQKPMQALIELNVRTLKSLKYIQLKELTDVRQPGGLLGKQVTLAMENSHKVLEYMQESFQIMEHALSSLSKEMKENTEHTIKQAREQLKENKMIMPKGIKTPHKTSASKKAVSKNKTSSKESKTVLAKSKSTSSEKKGVLSKSKTSPLKAKAAMSKSKAAMPARKTSASTQKKASGSAQHKASGSTQQMLNRSTQPKASMAESKKGMTERKMSMPKGSIPERKATAPMNKMGTPLTKMNIQENNRRGLPEPKILGMHESKPILQDHHPAGIENKGKNPFQK